jgi:hypothetical protein
MLIYARFTNFEYSVVSVTRMAKGVWLYTDLIHPCINSRSRWWCFVNFCTWTVYTDEKISFRRAALVGLSWCIMPAGSFNHSIHALVASVDYAFLATIKGLLVISWFFKSNFNEVAVVWALTKLWLCHLMSSLKMCFYAQNGFVLWSLWTWRHRHARTQATVTIQIHSWTNLCKNTNLHSEKD